MAFSENNKEKKDYFTTVMIVQSVVCAILVAFMLFSVKSEGKFAQVMKTGYLKFMTSDFSSEDFSEAFRDIKEYSAVFAQKSDPVETVAENTTESEETQEFYELPTGGADLEFSSLETLEGVCLEDVSVEVDFSEPLNDYEITSVFGYRVNPVSGETGIHTGLDMAADYGQPIYAAADGVVVDSAWDNSYGNYVKIRHDDNVVSIYAHCSVLCVSEGEKVKSGKRIARVGSTGASTGNHLHFEIRKDNIRINPGYILFGK